MTEGRPGDTQRVAGHARAEGEIARPAEPRPEIWFKRRVSLVAALRELWSFRELVITLAERDLRVRYKQAVLGIAWALLAPLAMMIAFTLIFSHITKVNTHGAPYALFSYLGLLPWTFFSGAISTGGLSLVSNVPLLNKLYCPREVFPLAAVADALVDMLIAAFVLLLLFPILGYAPRVQSFWVPLLFLMLFAVTLGATMAVSAIVVYMRDLRLLLPLVVQLGLFVTPVVFSVTTVTKNTTVQIIYAFVNPLVPIIDGMRRCVLFGQAPSWPMMAAGAASTLLVLLGSFWLFKRLEAGMADIA